MSTDDPPTILNSYELSFIEELKHDLQWRQTFCDLAAQMRTKDMKRLLDLPDIIRPEDVTRLIPQYQSLVNKSSLIGRILDVFTRFVVFVLLFWFPTPAKENEIKVSLIHLRPLDVKKNKAATFLISCTHSFYAYWHGIDARRLTSMKDGREVSYPSLLFLDGLNIENDTLSWNGEAIICSFVRSLACFKGQKLEFTNLSSLDFESAKALSIFEGSRLILDKITSVDDKTAEALAHFNGVIASKGLFRYLNGLSEMTCQQAALAINLDMDFVAFNNIQFLSPETAGVLSKVPSKWLQLNGLQDLDVNTALVLSQFEGNQLSVSVPSLKPDVAAALAQFKGWMLTLEGVTTLNLEAAQALALFRGKMNWEQQFDDVDRPAGRFSIIELYDLTELDEVSAKALAAFPGRFHCDNVLKEKIHSFKDNA